MKGFHIALVLGVLLLLLAPPVSALTLLVDSSGLLTGAQNVEFGDGTILYDVEFKDGTFHEVFGDPAEYDALTCCGFPGSNAFAMALLEQVFVDGPLGQFDSDPGLTFGCVGTTTQACIVATPHKFDNGNTSESVVFNGRAINFDASGVADDRIDNQNFSTSMDLSDFSGAVYADWTEATVIPIPATAWLFGSALGLLSWLRRKA